MGWNCVTCIHKVEIIDWLNDSTLCTSPLMVSESLSPDRVFHQVWPLQQWHSALHGAHSSEWPSRRYDSGATGWTVSTNTRRQTDGLKVTGIRFRGSCDWCVLPGLKVQEYLSRLRWSEPSFPCQRMYLPHPDSWKTTALKMTTGILFTHTHTAELGASCICVSTKLTSNPYEEYWHLI